MIARKAGPIHPSIEGARQRFDLWRKARSTSSPTSPIPEALWALAVKVTSAHAINKTAQALRLNYNALKERVKAEGGARGRRRREPQRSSSWCRRRPPSLLARSSWRMRGARR
jgi:hypothetical protein